MTNSEISAVLDQIIAALQEVHHKKPETYNEFYNKLNSILSNVPKNLLFKDVTDQDLRIKIAKVWNYFFAKNQCRSKSIEANQGIKLGTLNISARAILIAHRFYLDCVFHNNKTILLKLLDTLNISLISRTCAALKELDILEQILNAKLKHSDINIFKVLELQIEQKDNLKEDTSLIKLKEIRRFAEEILIACNNFGISHGFKSFELVVSYSANLYPNRNYTIQFLSKRHSWDFKDETLDNISPEDIELLENQFNKRPKLIM